MNYYGSLNIEIPDLTSYDLLNAREKLELEYLVGKYDARNVATDVNLKRQYNYLLSQVNKGVDTYWLSKPLRTGVGQTHNLRVEGGDYTFRYSASVQFNNTVGVMKESERKNFNGSLMLSYQHETLRFTNNTMLGFNNSSETPYGSFSDYVNMNPYFEPYDEYGNVIKTLGLLGDGASSRWSKGIANPLWNPETNTYDKSNSTSITNNFAINWDVFKGFTLRAALGVVYSMGGGDMFYSADHTMFADYTEDEMMEKGEYTMPGGAIFKMANLEELYLRSYFTVSQLAHVSIGQQVTVIADFGEDNQYEYPGKIVWIAEECEFTPKAIQTRHSRANLVYAVKIAVKNDGRLKIGQFGEVRL